MRGIPDTTAARRNHSGDAREGVGRTAAGRGHRLLAATAAAVFLLGAPTASAQEGGRVVVEDEVIVEAPEIQVSARGEVEVQPDRAVITVGVETEAKTASDAATRNAATQTRVLAAIRALGLSGEALRTTGYTVQPRQRYDQQTRRTVTEGYVVRNLVQVTVDSTAMVSAVIDAALGAGANRVAGLQFTLSDPVAAREAALTRAVQRARRDAFVAAVAAGGKLGALLELTVQQVNLGPRPVPMAAMARMEMADATPVETGTETVSVSVSTRWQFVPEP